MQIDIPDVEQQRLTMLAEAAGYDDVTRYVTEQLIALAHHATPRETSFLTDSELQESLEQCDLAMAESKAGEGRDMRAALDDIAARHGLGGT